MDQRWRGLLKVFGVLVLLASGLQFIVIAGTWPFLSSVSSVLSTLSVVCGISAGIAAVYRSQGQTTSGSDLVVGSDPASLESGPSARLVASVLRVMLLATVGMVLGGVFYYAGPRHMAPAGWLNDESFMLSTGARAGALVGSALVPAVRRTRVTLSLSAIAAWVAGAWLGDLGTPLVVALVIAISATPSAYSRKTASLQGMLLDVLRCTWGYSLGAAVGRTGGKVLGAALLGPLGWVVGEVVGEQVIATLGWLQTRPED
jgi:hypothetical protein